MGLASITPARPHLHSCLFGTSDPGARLKLNPTWLFAEPGFPNLLHCTLVDSALNYPSISTIRYFCVTQLSFGHEAYVQLLGPTGSRATVGK